MRAFTVHQPYAYAIVAGLKGCETRPRRTNIRGRVAVHAGKQRITLDSMRVVVVPSEGKKLHYGAVLGTVEIVDCVPVEDVVAGLSSPSGPWAWVLKNPVMFDTPIPARGKQGWWNWEGAGE